MQTVAVVFIVLLACVLVGRRLVRSFRAGKSCGGCAGCSNGSCSSLKVPEEKR